MRWRVTAGTLLDRTRKPLQLEFRAIFATRPVSVQAVMRLSAVAPPITTQKLNFMSAIRRVRRTPAPFQLIAHQLSKQIQGGLYVAGEALPPRRTLAKTFAVTINTMGKAIDELIKQGLINTTERHGTFISRDFKPTQARPSGLSHLVEGPPSSDRSTGLVALIAPMEGDIAALKLAPESPQVDRWAMTVLRGLEAALAEAGSQSRLYRIWPRDDACPDLATALAAAEHDEVQRLAIINIHNYSWISGPMLELIDPRRQPVICISGVSIDASFPQVCYDQRQAGYLAARHLVEAEYEHIVFALLAQAEWIEQRCDGAQRAIAQVSRRGTTFLSLALPGEIPSDIGIQDLSFSDLRVRLGEWFDHAMASGVLSPDGKAAVIVPSDRMAVALLAVMHERSMVPGRDLGVIGFDDYTGSMELGLSTVRPPLEQMGAFAAKQLLLNGTTATHCLPPLVLPRDSTWRKSSK